MVYNQLNPWYVVRILSLALERIQTIFLYYLSPFPLGEVELEAQTGRGTNCSVLHYLLDCVSRSTAGLLTVIAGGEEWGRIASFLQLSLSTMSEHSFRIMYIVLFHELLL